MFSDIEQLEIEATCNGLSLSQMVESSVYDNDPLIDGLDYNGVEVEDV